MSTASNILKNFNLFIDGRGYAGKVDTLKTPTLTIVGEDFRAGGMDSSVMVELGQEKLEATFTLSGYNSETLALWGVGEGQEIPFTARGTLESFDGTAQPVKVSMTGKVRSIEPGEWKAGERSSLAYTLDLSAYKYEQDGVTIHEIDIPNMVRIVNGVDRLKTQREHLGI